MGMLDGKVTLITGGAGGQGAAGARLFAAEGARVVIGDVNDGAGEVLAGEIGPACRYVHLDVTRESDWAGAVAQAIEEFGRLDVLVNNAGVPSQRSLLDTTLEEYLRVVSVNQVGPFLGIRAATPALSAAGGGSIINIGSVVALTGRANRSAYASSKWALRGLTRVAALELAPRGIRVNAVHPGVVETPMRHAAHASAAAASASSVPMGRGASPEEIAQFVAFLASDRSAYCTGADFVVDGGLVLAGFGPPRASADASDG